MQNNITLNTSENEKLSIWSKTAYAFGGLGNAIGPGTIIPFWYTYFLTDIARLDLGLVSLFWLIVSTWDAVNNPLIGYLSDRTKTRWGRRRPFLLYGAVPFGLFFILIWWIPPIQNQIFLFLYYLAVYILFETAGTIVNCPYSAMVPELTRDHDERTSLLTFQMVVTIFAGVLVPVIFGLLIIPMFPDRDPRAYQILALGCGICFVLTTLIAFFFSREKHTSTIENTFSFREALQFIKKNIPFRYALAIYIFGWMAVTVITSLFAYYFTYWIGININEISMLQGGILLMACLFLPLVLWLSQRFEKKTAYMFTAGTWAFLMLLTLFIPQGAKTIAFILCTLIGFGISGVHLLPISILPDVIEVDELNSGQRQEGVYMGVVTFISKMGKMLILASLPVLLQWFGYVQPVAGSSSIQPDTTLQAIRIIIAILPALLLGFSILAARFYPITRQKHRQIQLELEKRNSEKMND